MSALPIEFFGEILSTEYKDYTNKEGEKKTYRNATVYNGVSGAVGTFGVDSEETLKELEKYKRTEVKLFGEYNIDYKSVRIVGVEYYGD